MYHSNDRAPFRTEHLLKALHFAVKVILKEKIEKNACYFIDDASIFRTDCTHYSEMRCINNA